MPSPVYGPCGCRPDKRRAIGHPGSMIWRENKMAIDTQLPAYTATHSGQSTGRRFSSFCLAAQLAVAITATCVMTARRRRRSAAGRAVAIYRALSGCPPLARIDSVEHASLIWERAPTVSLFVRRRRFDEHANRAGCGDAACLAEMNTWRAALPLSFHQLHHCGPRFTIIRAMPYDRPFTVMAAFPLCPECDSEYRDRTIAVSCPARLPVRHAGRILVAGQHERAEKEAALQAAVAQRTPGHYCR